MASNSSAGVYVNEIDLSQLVAAASTSIGAIVGESARGPVGKRTLITSVQSFEKIFGRPDAKVSYMHYCALAFLDHGSRLYVTRVAPNSLFGGCTVAVLNNMNVTESWAQGSSEPEYYAFQADQLFTIYGANQGEWNSELKVILYPNTKVSDGTFFLEVYVREINRPAEKFMVHLDRKVDGYGVQLNVEDHINKRSSLIRIKQNHEHFEFRKNPHKSFINTLNVSYLEGGSDGTKATRGDIITGWELYRDPEQLDVNILINGGYSDSAIQIRMDEICSDRMDCMAVLDTPSMEQSVEDALNYRRNELMLDSSYSALYTPDYLILDQYNDIRLYVPPSGHVAAAYARTDYQYETWFAPAGMDRGRLSVLGVRHVYNQGDRDALTDSNINATRVIVGSGIRIWGADTLQTMASALSNVNVRRLMIFLEKSLSIAALYSVFDPNDKILWARLVELCERFLKPIRAGRGLYGFQVVCDESNNIPETIANGDLILDVYLDPVLPAKRIHLTAVVNRTGARFTKGEAN